MKKKICGMLALLLVLSTLTGCGEGRTEAPTETSTVPAVRELSATEIANLASQATVTVHTDGGTGSGFFIDDQGTLITCYHVIDGETNITVETADGAIYTVDTIVDFSELYDIAILVAKVKGNSYLEISEEPVTQGETVYALGASRGLDGTFSNGIISATSRKVGAIDCVQTTAATSGGNSGGPLLNVFCEVVGINAYGYSSGQNLNFAIDMSVLDKLTMDKYWNMSDFQEWYDKEIKRSYLVYDYDDECFYRSKIHTYQNITGEACVYSAYGWAYVKSGDGNLYDGYIDDTGIYYYRYDVNKFDQYCEYLKSIGFTYYDKKEYRDWAYPGTSFFYVNDYTGVALDMYVFDSEEWLVIEARYQ